jgi:hypothetical protein
MMPPMAQRTWGGRREGSGRKPLAKGERTVKITVSLLESDVEWLRRLGSGNVSSGIRSLVAYDRSGGQHHPDLTA